MVEEVGLFQRYSFLSEKEVDKVVVECKVEFVVVLEGFEEKMASLFVELSLILMKKLNFLEMIYLAM